MFFAATPVQAASPWIQITAIIGQYYAGRLLLIIARKIASLADNKGERRAHNEIPPIPQAFSKGHQWYYKDSYMKEFKVSSFKSAAYAMTMASYHNNRQVYCVITDQFGNQVTTETVTIHVTN